MNNTSKSDPHEVDFTSNRGRGGCSGGRSDGGEDRGGGDRGNDWNDRSDGGSNTFTRAPDSCPTCQICLKPGHTALQCWHRFDQAYQAQAPRNFRANNTTSNTWFPDNAASHHYTPDITNMRFDHLPYEGTEMVSLGDGSQIPNQNYVNPLLIYVSMDDERSSVLLPEDIIAEILVRLHIRPLFRFKLVSKQWKRIISDPKFAQYYLQRARSSPKSSALWRHWGLLFTHLNYCDEPRCLPSNDRDFRKAASNIYDIPLSLYESIYSTYMSWKHTNLHEILASSNGLVLSRLPPTSLHTIGEHNNWHKWSLELCVFNPLTKHSVKLPLLWLPYFPQAFGLATRAAQPEGENPTYITYKVVVIRSAKRRVDYASSSNLITIMTFSSDTGRWARKDLISCPSSILIGSVLESFTCRGILHWFHHDKMSIVTYDPYDNPDRFGRIWLPNSPGNILYNSGMHLLHSGHEDLLKYAEVERRSEFDRRLHVWCLADYAKGEWRLEQTFLVSPLLEDRSLSDCVKLIAPDPWNGDSFCMLYETENMVKAIDLGSAEVVYSDPSKVMAESGYWLETMMLLHISLCPWSSPYNAQARSNTLSEVGFRKISAVWFPS